MVSDPVALTDVMPTLLSLAGLEAPAALAPHRARLSALVARADAAEGLDDAAESRAAGSDLDLPTERSAAPRVLGVTEVSCAVDGAAREATRVL
mgnify:CR=1 FL=1